MSERTGLLLAILLVTMKLALAVALIPACIPPTRPARIGAPGHRTGMACPSCAPGAPLQWGECGACGRPLRGGR